MVSIVYKNEDFAVVNKAAGIPSQPDNSNDSDALSECAALLSVSSKEVYLVHRLDRVVGGLMAFARSSASAAKLSALFSREEIKKEYILICEGVPKERCGVLRDNLKKDAILGRAVVLPKGGKGGKPCELEYELIKTVSEDGRLLSLIRVYLKTGRFHQIRAQFSSRGLPLLGDGKYGSKFTRVRMPMLFASGLSFIFDGKEYSFSALPSASEYPWSLFDFSLLGDQV